MSNPIPSQIALSTITNGTPADGSVVQANDQLIQTAVNQIIAGLSNGSSGQFLQAVDASDVQWGNAADKSSGALQAFTSALKAPFLGNASSTCALASGAITVTSGAARITSTDASTLTTINGRPDNSGWFLVLVNASGSTIGWNTGGGAGVGLSIPGALPNGARMLLWFDPVSVLWVPVAYTSGITYNNIIQMSYGTTVTPNAATGSLQQVTVNNTTAWTLANPVNPPPAGSSQQLTIEVIYTGTNNANGAITLGNAYWIGGAAGGTLQPANSLATNARAIYVFYWDGSFWMFR